MYNLLIVTTLHLQDGTAAISTSVASFATEQQGLTAEAVVNESEPENENMFIEGFPLWRSR